MYYIHVNKNTIFKNGKHGTNDPVIKFQKGKHGKSVYCHELEITGPSKMVYSPHEPILPCGAKLVIQTEIEPVIIT